MSQENQWEKRKEKIENKKHFNIFGLHLSTLTFFIYFFMNLSLTLFFHTLSYINFAYFLKTKPYCFRHSYWNYNDISWVQSILTWPFLCILSCLGSFDITLKYSDCFFDKIIIRSEEYQTHQVPTQTPCFSILYLFFVWKIKGSILDCYTSLKRE